MVCGQQNHLSGGVKQAILYPTGKATSEHFSLSTQQLYI